MELYRILAYVAILLGLVAAVPIGAVGAAAAGGAADAADPSAAEIYLTEGVGDSMEPTMGPGDRALCIEWAEYEVGDVVGVDRGEFADSRHRIVAMNESVPMSNT